MYGPINPLTNAIGKIAAAAGAAPIGKGFTAAFGQAVIGEIVVVIHIQGFAGRFGAAAFEQLIFGQTAFVGGQIGGGGGRHIGTAVIPLQQRIAFQFLGDKGRQFHVG